jgi:hypothetical protein
MGLETPLITAAQLRASLTEEVYMAIFDDARTGDVTTVDVSDGVTEVLNDAHAFVISSLGPIYTILPLSTDASIDTLLIAAEKQWARMLSFERRPEFEHNYGYGGEKDRAESRAKWLLAQIQSAAMRLVTAPPEPKPTNVGGAILSTGQRVMLPNADGSSNSGDF